MDTFEVTFLGTNGSVAHNNGNRKKYGSNTLCIAVKAGEEVLLLDAGSGIYGLSGLTDYIKPNISLLFTHYHADHIEGLLFCRELFDPARKFTIYGSDSGGYDMHDVLENYLSPPISPVGFGEFRAGIDFKTIVDGDVIEYPSGVIVRVHSVSHPGGAFGYRVEYGGKSFCSCCDVELGNHKAGDGFLEFIHGADLLVLDSFFEDGKTTPGWGHSSWHESASWAKQADVKKLALLHYAPYFTDDDIDDMQEKARGIFPNTFTAADHMMVGV